MIVNACTQHTPTNTKKFIKRFLVVPRVFRGNYCLLNIFKLIFSNNHDRPSSNSLHSASRYTNQSSSVARCDATLKITKTVHFSREYLQLRSIFPKSNVVLQYLITICHHDDFLNHNQAPKDVPRHKSNAFPSKRTSRKLASLSFSHAGHIL